MILIKHEEAINNPNLKKIGKMSGEKIMSLNGILQF
jgi:hypothetical protein